MHINGLLSLPYSIALFISVDTANSLSPSPIPSHTDLPKGDPGAGKRLPPMISFDTSKASRILGPELKYHSMDETTRDALEDFERRGW